MPCDAQNTEHQVHVMAVQWLSLCMSHLNCASLALNVGHLVLAPKGSVICD